MMPEEKFCKFMESVYRTAKICELYEKEGASAKKRIPLDYEMAMKIANRLKEREPDFFESMGKGLPKGAILKRNERDRIRDEFREGPIAIFPAFELIIDNNIYDGRFCATVCMGKNRSKLWIRLSSRNKQELPQQVNLFYQKAKKLTDSIGRSLYEIYRIVVEECVENSVLIDAYDIPVMGTNLADEKFGKDLKRINGALFAMGKAFEKSPFLFDISKAVVFPNCGLEINTIDDYTRSFGEKHEWIGVQGSADGEISVFLKCRNEEKNETRFAGFGTIILPPQDLPFTQRDAQKYVAQRATRDVLSVISPNI
jgi:hypothetical protein